MGQVTVTIGDRAYRLACEAGQEARVEALAAYVRSKITALTAETGHASDERLMLMAALLIADELWEARGALPVVAATQEPDRQDAADEPEAVGRLRALAREAGSAGARDGVSAPAGTERKAAPRKRHSDG